MRIVFATLQHPSGVAKALRRFLAGRDRRLSLLDSKDLVARMYGYADWADLVRSIATPASPFDHLVSREEAAGRHAAYRAAMLAFGLAETLAEAAIEAVRPTALPDAPPPLDIMRGPQADRLGVAGFDAAGLAATEGGARLLRGMRTAAAADPHWARRGCLRARFPDDPWLARMLGDMRASPVHEAWTPLAVLCLAELARLLAPDHPFLGPLLPGLAAALAAHDPGTLGQALHAAPAAGLLSLVAHVEDVLPILLARHAPFPREGGPVSPPEVRAPWRPRHPFDLTRHAAAPQSWTREDLAGLDLFREGMPAQMLLRVGDAATGTNRLLVAAARAAGHDLTAESDRARGPLGRDDLILAAAPDGRVLGAVLVRSRADPNRRAFHLDFVGPFPVGSPDPAFGRDDVESFLLAGALDRFEDDLRSWGRETAPGSRLAIFVAPAREATDAFLRRFVRVAGERYEAAEREMPELGLDVVVRNVTRDGAPAPLPDLHLATVPTEAAAAWRAFEGQAARLAEGLSGPVLTRLRPDGVDLLGGDGRPLSGAGETPEEITGPAGIDALRHVVAEAGLGHDASVFLSGGFTAVIARESVENRDWSGRRGICLVVERRPGEGERERLLNRFWAAFPGELDGILATRAETRPTSPAHYVAGPSRPQ